MQINNSVQINKALKKGLLQTQKQKDFIKIYQQKKLSKKKEQIHLYSDTKMTTSLQQSDQSTYSFLFIITPLQIISTKSIKNLKKSILIKLGTQTEKTSQLNKPIDIYVDVLYSKTLKKYCPIKGIIKIYDINLDGSEVISSVGGFQTQELLNQNKNNIVIQKDVGSSKLKMKIQIKNLGIAGKGKSIEKADNLSSSRQKQSKISYVSKSRIIENKQQKIQKDTQKINEKSNITPLNQSRISQTNVNSNSNTKVSYTYPYSTARQQPPVVQQPRQVPNSKGVNYFKLTSGLTGSAVQSPTINQQKNLPNSLLKKKNSQVLPSQSENNKMMTNSNIESAKQKTNLNKRYSRGGISSLQDTNSIPSQSQYSQTYLRQKQNQQLGQQLLQQRRKNTQLQQKLAKYHLKVNSLKKKIIELQKQKDTMIYHFQKISDGVEMKGGKIVIELNQKQKAASLKYKNKQFQKVFGQFIEYMTCELKKPRSRSISKQKQDDTSFEDSRTSQKKPSSNPLQSDYRYKALNEQLNKKTAQLFSLRAKQRQRSSLEIKLKTKQKQCSDLQNKLKQSQILKKTLKQQNQYLKQKDQTMQQIISQKQNQIELLKQQILDIEVSYKELQSTIKNDQCQIQQLKEQVSNLNQMVQKYRQKYGDLKNVKNRALQNQLKECLMWIDQQTRQLEMSDFVQQTQPSHSHNVSQIIKNIQFQGATRQEMNSIKQELATLIKRIDNFLMK